MAAVDWLFVATIALLAATATGSIAFLVETAFRDRRQAARTVTSAEVRRLVISFLTVPFRDPLTMRRLGLAPKRDLVSAILDLAPVVDPASTQRLRRLAQRLRVTDNLVEGLGSPSRYQRLESARAANLLGLDAPEMAALIDDPWGPVREQAMFWVQRHGSAADVHAVVRQYLAGRNQPIALDVMRERADAAIPSLKRALERLGPSAWLFEAASACRWLPSNWSRFRDHVDGEVRAALATMLGQVLARRRVRRGRTTTTRREARNTDQWFSDVQTEFLEDALRRYAGDLEPAVRAAAIEAMFDAGMDVSAYVADTDWRAGRRAAIALIMQDLACPLTDAHREEVRARYEHAQRWVEAAA